MNKTTEEKIRKDLRPYAVLYDRIIGENPTEKSIRWTSEKCDRLLRGRWLTGLADCDEVQLYRGIEVWGRRTNDSKGNVGTVWRTWRI